MTVTDEMEKQNDELETSSPNEDVEKTASVNQEETDPESPESPVAPEAKDAQEASEPAITDEASETVPDVPEVVTAPIRSAKKSPVNRPAVPTLAGAGVATSRPAPASSKKGSRKSKAAIAAAETV